MYRKIRRDRNLKIFFDFLGEKQGLADILRRKEIGVAE
jgi:hypothetical protein